MNKQQTRKMLDMVKHFQTSFQRANLNEQIEQSDPTVTQPQNDDVTVINDVDVKFLSNDKSDLMLSDDQKNKISELIDGFRVSVSQTGNLEPGFTFTPGQIRLDGELTDETIKFVFISGTENGIYIIADMLKLEQNTANLLEKLVKFQETFENVCDPIINDRTRN